ncbi:hypothetical protein WOLCODRAFT_151035 [Wolfiporia cocos MD-104 SS10]|uniref:Uncharacterized protein n=1 Tax=Wolfiporia cocos (strain MD-104) TaxID=742152 RepID=A0A2H3JFL9_WOLCO|nr:hypothetical protein WOLCODRAFT_151035 [Wolfiporia cocos MD-104 SS10]
MAAESRLSREGPATPPTDAHTVEDARGRRRPTTTLLHVAVAGSIIIGSATMLPYLLMRSRFRSLHLRVAELGAVRQHVAEIEASNAALRSDMQKLLSTRAKQLGDDAQEKYVLEEKTCEVLDSVEHRMSEVLVELDDARRYAAQSAETTAKSYSGMRQMLEEVKSDVMSLNTRVTEGEELRAKAYIEVREAVERVRQTVEKSEAEAKRRNEAYKDWLKGLFTGRSKKEKD